VITKVATVYPGPVDLTEMDERSYDALAKEVMPKFSR
jgi:hypothetical protein